MAPTFDNKEELDKDSFDKSKLGVKGLVDLGLKTIPTIFHHPPETRIEYKPSETLDPKDDPIQIPLVDLLGDHEELVKQLREATSKYGFFQVINHGVSVSLMDRVLDSIKAFHELESGEKMRFYNRDTVNSGTGVGFVSNYDLYQSKAASWRDAFIVRLAPIPVDPNDIPQVCRSEVIEWDKEVKQLGKHLMRLLSQGLGLNPDRLTGDSYLGRRLTIGHYYPYCPEPEKTVGISSHTDPGILTVLLQDQIGGLQVKCDDKWIDLKPTPGALVINIGDLFQILSNDEYISGEHRVRANSNPKPRTSVAFFFSPGDQQSMYGPLPELVTSQKPALYQQFTCSDFIKNYLSKELKGNSMTTHFRI